MFVYRTVSHNQNEHRSYHKNDRKIIIQVVKDGLAEYGFEYANDTSEFDLMNILVSTVRF